MAVGLFLAAGATNGTIAHVVPMLIDRDCLPMNAVRASWRAVADHPLVLAFWASLIACLVLVGLLSFLLGLLVVVPLLAHASWHAYRDLSASASAAAAVGRR